MNYNRWMPPECSTELYHHGVKGMKWGQHIFGKINLSFGKTSSSTQSTDSSGGGGVEQDLEFLSDEDIYKAEDEAIKDFENDFREVDGKVYMRRGNNWVKLQDDGKSQEWKDRKQKMIDIYVAKRLGVSVDRYHQEQQKRWINGTPGTSRFKYRDTRKAIEKIEEEDRKEQKRQTRARSQKEYAETRRKEKAREAYSEREDNKSYYEKNKDKMHYTVGSRDQDAMVRTYTAKGRDRYRQNGKYRNMNLTDVYGPNAKANGKVGFKGADLYKDLDVDDIHDGKNYSTRDFDTSKYHDGRYSTRDKIREKITGKADPDNLKKRYNDLVYRSDRVGDQRHAYSVGVEEMDVRRQARKRTDEDERYIKEHSIAGWLERKTKKKPKRRW